MNYENLKCMVCGKEQKQRGVDLEPLIPSEDEEEDYKAYKKDLIISVLFTYWKEKPLNYNFSEFCIEMENPLIFCSEDCIEKARILLDSESGKFNLIEELKKYKSQVITSDDMVKRVRVYNIKLEEENKKLKEQCGNCETQKDFNNLLDEIRELKKENKVKCPNCEEVLIPNSELHIKNGNFICKQKNVSMELYEEIKNKLALTGLTEDSKVVMIDKLILSEKSLQNRYDKQLEAMSNYAKSHKEISEENYKLQEKIKKISERNEYLQDNLIKSSKQPFMFYETNEKGSVEFIYIEDYKKLKKENEDLKKSFQDFETEKIAELQEEIKNMEQMYAEANKNSVEYISKLKEEHKKSLTETETFLKDMKEELKKKSKSFILIDKSEERACIKCGHKQQLELMFK
jgi:hypothetical protein